MPSRRTKLETELDPDNCKDPLTVKTDGTGPPTSGSTYLQKELDKELSAVQP